MSSTFPSAKGGEGNGPGRCRNLSTSYLRLRLLCLLLLTLLLVRSSAASQGCLNIPYLLRTSRTPARIMGKVSDRVWMGVVSTEHRYEAPGGEPDHDAAQRTRRRRRSWVRHDRLMDPSRLHMYYCGMSRS